MPLVTMGATVLGMYSHIAYSVDKEEEEIPPPFKGAKPKQIRGKGKPKGKPEGLRQNPTKTQEAEEAYGYDSPNNYYHNDNYTTPRPNQGADLLTVKAVTSNLEASRKEAETKDLSITNANFKIIDLREAHLNIPIINTALTINPIFKEIKQITTEDKAVAGVLNKLEDTVMVGPITRVTMALTSISIIHMIRRQNSMAHPVVYAVVSIIPLSTATKENMT